MAGPAVRNPSSGWRRPAGTVHSSGWFCCTFADPRGGARTVTGGRRYARPRRAQQCTRSARDAGERTIPVKTVDGGKLAVNLNST